MPAYGGRGVPLRSALMRTVQVTSKLFASTIGSNPLVCFRKRKYGYRAGSLLAPRALDQRGNAGGWVFSPPTPPAQPGLRNHYVWQNDAHTIGRPRRSDRSVRRPGDDPPRRRNPFPAARDRRPPRSPRSCRARSFAASKPICRPCFFRHPRSPSQLHHLINVTTFLRDIACVRWFGQAGP